MSLPALRECRPAPRDKPLRTIRGTSGPQRRRGLGSRCCDASEDDDSLGVQRADVGPRVSAGLRHNVRMRRVVAALVSLIALVVAVVLYFSVGWDRMASYCGSPSGFQSAIPPETDSASVTYSWRWAEGFTCTYTTNTIDTTRSSYWF